MSPTDESSDLLDVKALASAMGVSVTTIWRLKQAGKLRFRQPGGKGHAVRFFLSDIDGDDTNEGVKSTPSPNLPDGHSSSTPTGDNEAPRDHLAGRKPKWM